MYHSDQRYWPENIALENLALEMKNNGYYNISIMSTAESSIGAINKYIDVNIHYNRLRKPETLSEQIRNMLSTVFFEGIRVYDWYVKEDFIASLVLDRISTDSSVTNSRPQIAFNKFYKILDEGVPAPYFAWIHLFPPHFAYLPPDEYKGMFDPSGEMRTLKSQRDLIDHSGKLKSSNDRQLGLFKARYDEFIRYCDDQFKGFIADMETMNRLKNTIILLSSDHGESFDHGYFAHGGPHLYESVTHIPLIIK